MRLLLRAFPAGFRRRYGLELLDLARAGDRPLRDGFDIVLAGIRERLAGASGPSRDGTRRLLPVAVLAAAAGSVALGGCVLLGSAAAAGTCALVATCGLAALAPAP